MIGGGHIYILDDPGVAECFELTTGKLVWEERLKGAGAKSDSWGSMVLSGERLYVVNQSGDAFVLKASPKFEVLATNTLDDGFDASPALVDHELYLRGNRYLYCIAEP